MPTTQDTNADLQQRFERILAKSRDYGDGGRLVLETAYHTLAAGRAMDRWPDVGLEDLWAHAIQEGRTLFNDDKARWGRTGPRETKDMIGQTTVGPWQLTTTNIQNEYGVPYGVHADWTMKQVFDFCESHPAVQAGMICDYIQKSYSMLGTRSPYAIQRYFWLEAFVKNEIGQGQWDKSVLPTPPDGDWKKLTPAMKADTGFYAKQILLGYKTKSDGLLYWLWVTGDLDAISATLSMWKTQHDGTWNDAKQTVDWVESSGRFAVKEEDLKWVPDEARAAIADRVRTR